MRQQDTNASVFGQYNDDNVFEPKYRIIRDLILALLHGRRDRRNSVHVGQAHANGAVIGGPGAEPDHATIELVARVTEGIADRGLEAEFPGGIHLARRQAKRLATLFEVVVS